MRRAPTGYGNTFCPNKAYGEFGQLDPDEIILNCYRLADRFHQNPELFLEMPVTRVNWHIHYTVKLIEAQNKAQRAAQND
jgi:hypothetical protein